MHLTGNGYSVFDTTGTFIRSYRAVGKQAQPWPGGCDQAGRFYDWAFGLRDDGSPKSLLVAYSPGDNLVPVDTVVLPLPETEAIEFAGGSIRKPFGTEAHWHLDPRGYLWTGKDDRYRIVQLTLSGDTVGVIEKAHEPAPVRADAEVALGRIAPVLARMAGSATASPKDIALPRQPPAYEAFITDDRGNLWVNRTLAEDLWKRSGVSGRCDVFNSDGVYLGEVASPIGVWEWGTKPVFRGGYMAGVVTDSMNVDYVVRGRLVRRG